MGCQWIRADVGATPVVALFMAGHFTNPVMGSPRRKRGDHKGRPYIGSVGGRRLWARPFRSDEAID